MTASITVVGTGIQAVAHLTREAEAAVRQASVVLLLDTNPGVREALCQLCPDVRPLYREMYREHHARVDGYHLAAALVLDAALTHGPVVFAIQGHPLVFALPAFLVRDGALALGIPFRVLPGVSAIDTLCADLGVDPGAHGMQLVEATDLLLRRRPLQPDMPALIWQVGNLETRLHSRSRSKPARLNRLTAYLLRYYPADHPVVALFSAPHPLARPTRIQSTVSGLQAHASDLHPGFTVYIPPTHARPVVDTDLLARLDDPDHLARIVR